MGMVIAVTFNRWRLNDHIDKHYQYKNCLLSSNFKPATTLPGMSLSLRIIRTVFGRKV
jgi:hypothetical protein